jgi:hypothetical protein
VENVIGYVVTETYPRNKMEGEIDNLNKIVGSIIKIIKSKIQYEKNKTKL